MMTGNAEHRTPEKEMRKGVLGPGGSAGGPLGIGDPADMRLRKVEKDILIPRIMRDRTREEKSKCNDIVREFEKCGKAAGLAVVYKCREENNRLKACLESWYTNPSFIQECTEQYLRERSEFRRTGIMKPKEERIGSKEFREAKKKREAAAAALASSESSLPLSSGEKT